VGSIPTVASNTIINTTLVTYPVASFLYPKTDLTTLKKYCTIIILQTKKQFNYFMHTTTINGRIRYNLESGFSSKEESIVLTKLEFELKNNPLACTLEQWIQEGGVRMLDGKKEYLIPYNEDGEISNIGQRYPKASFLSKDGVSLNGRINNSLFENGAYGERDDDF
jgi:hypothetical protein